MGELRAQDAKQNSLHREYQARIIALEAGNRRLHAELAELRRAPQAPVEGGTHGPPSNAARGASCWAPLNGQAQQAPAQSASDSAAKKAAALSEPAAKKTVSHADVTALMATRPGGKDWQTVLKKATRPQKQPTPVQTQEKGARRLIF
jgi:hypothetical protein